jgi:dTDP-4-dehydrorhamnose reductase
MRILQFGRTGQVGMEILLRAGARGHQVTALGRDIVDLAEPGRVPRAVAIAGPVDIVINGAAYTAVDKAETEPERANTVNGESVGALAEVCARRGMPIIHLSTDYVFDGTKGSPYTEDDPPHPLNAYGRSKLLGERLLRERQPRHVILRTSWVYSAHGQNFVRTMLRLGVERDELKIVDDQHGAPTAAGDIAEACLALCEQVGARGDAMPWGTYHFAAAGETTWYGFARAIFDEAPWAGIKARVRPIPTTDYPTSARRPLDSRLDCSEIARAFGIKGRPWREALRAVLAEIRRIQEEAAQ